MCRERDFCAICPCPGMPCRLIGLCAVAPHHSDTAPDSMLSCLIAVQKYANYLNQQTFLFAHYGWWLAAASTSQRLTRLSCMPKNLRGASFYLWKNLRKADAGGLFACPLSVRVGWDFYDGRWGNERRGPSEPLLGGVYRSRTDDLLTASQTL